MYLIENDLIALRQYTHDDDYDMYLCWNDIDTQKGYNGIFDQSFEEFNKFDIDRFKFWVTAVDKATNESVGTLRLGTGEVPDLAILDLSAVQKSGIWNTILHSRSYIFVYT